MNQNVEAQLNLSVEALRMAVLHEDLAIQYERKLARASEPLRQVYLEEMIARQREVAAHKRAMVGRLTDTAAA